MQTLLPTLLDYDPGMLAIIAHRWDVDLDDALDKRAVAETLAAVMLDEHYAAMEWGRLDDPERGALQMLLSADNCKMTEVQFSRLFGEIRQMGPGRRDREKPHLNPANVTETLHFRGLVALTFDQSKTGVQSFIYIPPDLAAILPAHETGFALPPEKEAEFEGQTRPPLEPATTVPASTTLVDDLTTLLAYLQLNPVSSTDDTLSLHITTALSDHWIGDHSPASTALLISLAFSLGLAGDDDDGFFRPFPTPARRWLEKTRPRQVRALAEAWCNSTLFNELWHTPGLRPETTGWRNDPLLARQTVLTFLEMVPSQDWWSVADLVAIIKAEEPDFQRPAGDYDSWYIRAAETGEYLRGFEHWDAVDGAVLAFTLTGPMHWLGLVDLGDDRTACRLTAYGRALCDEQEWPDPPEDRPHLILQTDGTILAPRALNRYERFQLARITEWGPAGDPYTYRMTATGLQLAAEQNITTDAMRAFLSRTSGGALPDGIDQMLARWEQTGSADTWLTRAVILRTGTPETLQTILETPDLRRYLGTTLGPTAVIVRAGQENDLTTALHQHGILVEFDT